MKKSVYIPEKAVGSGKKRLIWRKARHGEENRSDWTTKKPAAGETSCVEKTGTGISVEKPVKHGYNCCLWRKPSGGGIEPSKPLVISAKIATKNNGW